MATGRRFLFHSSFLLFVSAVCLPLVANATSLPATAEDITPLGAGDDAPAFTVRTVDGDPYAFDPATLEKPTVLISFRGGWCPYCNLHLSELRSVLPEIRSMGFDVLFISNDRPEILYSSLQQETKDDIGGLDYLILSDSDLHAARAFGTAFRIADGVIPYLEKKGRDYKDSSIDRFNALAVPAVYVVGADGKIAFDFVNADYKVRLPAEKLLEIAGSLRPE